MPGLPASTYKGDQVQQLIAQAARRLSADASEPTKSTQRPRATIAWSEAKPTSVKRRAISTNNQADAALRPTSCPFRRSHSKPESPTSDMGEQAIAEEASQLQHPSTRKLILLRRFSVSEEDVVTCNRVRCGVDPSWFRHRTTGHDVRRYQRSLSVEEARLAATRRRISRTGSSLGTGTRQLTLTVPENQPLDDPALVSSNNKLNSPHIRHVIHEEPEDDGVPRFTSELGPAPLTPREKAMHGRYLIRESFANGSYGQVCAGEDLPSHQEVAVKIIPKYILVSPEEKQSVIREQVIHKSLNHPHIIKLIDVFEDEGAHYFILERADTGSLSTLITYAGMPEDQARDVFRQLLQALEYLHVNNIVHHDIKPNNILLHKGGGDIKLCDFGASRAFNSDEASLPYAGVFGTPGYIAPELLLGEKAYGPAIDMFSAGILLFEMTFGFMPFYPPSACTYQPLDFPAKAPASAELRHLISRLLEKDPTQRITASQALGHPWITLGTPGRSQPSSPMCSPRGVLSPRSRAARKFERCIST